MYRIASEMLCSWLIDRDIFLKFEEGRDCPDIVPGIHFLSKADLEAPDGYVQNASPKPLNPDYLYLCERNILEGSSFSRLPSDQNFLFLAAAPHKSHAEGPDLPDACDLPDTVSLIYADLDLLDLANFISDKTMEYCSWVDRMESDFLQNVGLDRMLESAASYIPDCTIAIVNNGYRKIALHKNADIQDPIIDELEEKGYCSFDTIESIKEEQHHYDHQINDYHEFVYHGRNRHLEWDIYNRQARVAKAIIVLKDAGQNFLYRQAGQVISYYVRQYLTENRKIYFSEDAGFSTMIADLIELRLTDEREIGERKRQVHLMAEHYYHVMLITFAEDTTRIIPWNLLIEELHRIFVYSNICTYKNEILMVIRRETRSNMNPFRYDKERFLSLLEKNNAYAVLSNTSNDLRSLNFIYHQTHDAMKIVHVMEPERRFFNYESFSMYHIISLAGLGARIRYGDVNIIHLCDNEMIALLLYDKKHETDMIHVLAVYLSTNCNVAESARLLYIHRNTMINKIHKIEEIIGTDLSSPILRERLMFSYHVLKFAQQYKHEDVLVRKKFEKASGPREEIPE